MFLTGGNMDAIEFLELVGSDANMLHGAQDDLYELVESSPLDMDLKTALAARDSNDVYRLLGQGVQMAVQVPGEEEEAPDEDEDGGDGKLPELRL